MALEFIQLLWSAIQGTGGIVDLILAQLTNVAPALAVSESVVAQNSDKASPLSSLVGRMIGMEQEIAALRNMVARALVTQLAFQLPPAPAIPANPFAGLPPLVNPRIGPSAVTWTPTIAGSTTAGTQTYNEQFGFTVEIGPLTMVLFAIGMTVLDGTTAGNILINGLQIASSATGQQQAGWLSVWSNITLTGGNTAVGIQIQPGTNSFLLIQNGTGITSTVLQAAALAANTAIYGGAMYFH